LTFSDAHLLDETNKIKVYVSLEKLLASQIFTTSPRQQRFLKYLIDQTLNGNSEQLKGYTIGVEVFDRGNDFDSTLDSIVRVEAGRLRSKLREYYEVEGRRDAIRFDFPKGTYTIDINFKHHDDKIIFMRHDDVPHLTKIEHEQESIALKLSPVSNIPTLAILPFANISADPSNAYLADGITDSLFFALSNLSALVLTSRQTSFVYRDKPIRAEEIGLELGVRYLLEGSVQRIENRLRISVQLSDSQTGRCLWTERYDRQLDDVFNLQDEITHNVVKMLHIKLLPTEKDMIGHEGTVSLVAYDLLMVGLEEHWKYTPSSSKKAVSCINLALQHDPDYAAAHTWLARAMVFEWIMHWNDNDEILNHAYEHARTAVQLNKYLPCAYSVLGWVQLWRKNVAEAIADCRKGVSLDSSGTDGLTFLSMSLSASGLGVSALHYIEMAMQLTQNPSSFHFFALGQAQYVLGNYELAENAWRKGCNLSDSFILNHYCLCLLYALLDRDKECQTKREEIKAKNYGACLSVRSVWMDETLGALHQELVKKALLA
jgi:TolB-like protein